MAVFATLTTKQSLPAPALAESMRVFLPALPPATPEPIELTDHHATTVTLESLALVDYSLMTMYGYELRRHEKALFFKMESTHRIGVIVRPADAPRLSWEEVLEAFADFAALAIDNARATRRRTMHPPSRAIANPSPTNIGPTGTAAPCSPFFLPCTRPYA